MLIKKHHFSSGLYRHIPLDISPKEIHLNSPLPTLPSKGGLREKSAHLPN